MQHLSLVYPNGRSHDVDLEGEKQLGPGDVFELYGRAWRVVAVTPRTRRHLEDVTVVCRSVTASPLGRAKLPSP